MPQGPLGTRCSLNGVTHPDTWPQLVRGGKQDSPTPARARPALRGLPPSPSPGRGAGLFPAAPWGPCCPFCSPVLPAQDGTMLADVGSGCGELGADSRGENPRARRDPPGKDESTREGRTGRGQPGGTLTVHGNLHLLHVPERQRPRQVPGHRPRGEDHGDGHRQLELSRGVSPGTRAPGPAAPAPPALTGSWPSPSMSA